MPIPLRVNRAFLAGRFIVFAIVGIVDGRLPIALIWVSWASGDAKTDRLVLPTCRVVSTAPVLRVDFGEGTPAGDHGHGKRDVTTMANGLSTHAAISRISVGRLEYWFRFACDRQVRETVISSYLPYVIQVSLLAMKIG